MSTRKTYKPWRLELQGLTVARIGNGELGLTSTGSENTVDVVLPAKEARRLYRKLSGDYRD